MKKLERIRNMNETTMDSAFQKMKKDSVARIMQKKHVLCALLLNILSVSHPASSMPMVPPIISVVASNEPAEAIWSPLVSVRKDAPQSRIVSLIT
jgi:hypothetical protein